MRRLVSLFILSLLLFSFTSLVFGQETNSENEDLMLPGENTPEESKDLENLKDITSKIPINSETGKFDVSKIENLKLNATKRIKAINDYINETAPWTKPIFRMVPEISWLFFANLYVFLFFFTILVLNGDEFFFYMSKGWMAYLSGIGLFAIGLVTMVYLNLALLLVKVVDLALDIFAVGGMIALVLGIIGLVVLIFMFPMFIRFVLKIPVMLLKGTGLRKVVNEGMSEVKRLKKEREVAESLNEGMEG